MAANYHAVSTNTISAFAAVKNKNRYKLNAAFAASAAFAAAAAKSQIW